MPAKILKPSQENFAILSEAIRRGDLVAMPTETVYGLAGDAKNERALAKIFATKERPTFDPLIVHVSAGSNSVAELDRQGLVDSEKLSPTARELVDRLMNRFWPGPLTLVLPKKESVPDLATSGLASVGLRMPRHPVAQSLLAACGTPLAAPSANRFGRISPTSAQDVMAELGDRIDWILDGDHCDVGVESTIIGVSEQGALTLLRPGGLPLEEIEAAAGSPIPRAPQASAGTISGMAAPGMLASHYAPRKELVLLSAELTALRELPSELLSRGSLAILSIRTPEDRVRTELSRLGARAETIRVLSPKGDLNEAARALFRGLRELDGSKAEILVAEPCELKTGLGYAIGDRLRRAAAKRDH